MDFLDPPVPFDVTKPFYGVVVAYLSQLHGFIELASRGLSLRLETMPEAVLAEVDAAGGDPKTRAAVERIRAGGRTGLLGEQELASVTASVLKVHTSRLAEALLVDYAAALRNFNRVTAGGLLIVAWAITEAYHSHDPLWEFLRHCRNAAAHRGRFHFEHREPRRAAAWRGLQLVPELQGSTLVRDSSGVGYLHPGDVIYLLADIEAAFPHIE